MKTILFLILVWAITLQAKAQEGLFENLTKKYSSIDGFSASKITNDMFDLYLKKRNIEEKTPVYDALKNLNNILIVSQTNIFNLTPPNTNSKKNGSEVEAIHSDILNHYQGNNYLLLKTEKYMGEDVKVFIKKNKDKIVALALVTNSTRATNLVELQGSSIDLSSVSELNRALNLRGLESLYKINSRNVHGIYAPTPPDIPSEEHVKMLLDKHRELIENQSQLTEEQRRKIEERAELMAEKQMEMAAKHRELAQKYQRQPIFLSTPGDSVEYFIDGRKATADEVKNINPSDIERVEVNKNKSNSKMGTVKITTRK